MYASKIIADKMEFISLKAAAILILVSAVITIILQL